MSSKTVSRSTAAVAVATFLTLAGAAPSVAAPRSSGEPGARVPISAWSFMMSFSERLVKWASSAAFDKIVPSAPDSADISYGADPNGNQLTMDPSNPVGTVPGPGGRG
jgi:hypothetical protein